MVPTIKHKQQRSQTQSGFTLVELLVVISVIGVLAGLLLVNFVGVRGRAADARKKNDASAFQKAMRLYYNDYNQYPVGTGSTINACGVDGDSACDRSSGSPFSAGATPTIYMNHIPEDLLYYNPAGSNPDQFVIVMPLENVGDQEVANSQARCAPSINDVEGFTSLSLTETSYVLCDN